MTKNPIEIIDASDAAHVPAVRELFLEYAQSLGFSLCFQGFDAELAALPGDYSPERGGRVLLARRGSDDAGCVGMRRMDDAVCEMKRLYVRPAFRGLGFGKVLAERIIEEGRRAGYLRMRLDTLPSMERAVAMYLAFGFREIDSYRHNPIPGAKYMELDLAAGK